MNGRDLVLLRQVRDHIAIIRDMTDGLGEDGFMASREKQDACALRLGLIGEAVGRVSREFRDAHPGLPWRQMVGMRNRIFHDYLDIDFVIVWQTVTDDLPAVDGAIAAVLASEEP